MAESPVSPPDDKGDDAPSGVDDDRPPILGSWRRIYTLVLVSQAALIGLFYWFTVSFR